MSIWKWNVRRLQESALCAVMSARPSAHIRSIAVVRCMCDRVTVVEAELVSC